MRKSFLPQTGLPLLALMVATGALVAGVAALLGAGTPALILTGVIAGASCWLIAAALLVRPLEETARRAEALAEDLQDRPLETRRPRSPLQRLRRSLEALQASLSVREARLREAEQAVQQNEARYRDLFENNPLAMVVFDTETLEILAANDAAMRQYGFTRPQFLRMTVRHLFADPMNAGPNVVLHRMAVDQSEPVEDVHRRRDGTRIDVQVACHRIRFAGRAAALAMLTDITARKQAEAENRMRMEEQEALYRTLLEQTRTLSLQEVAVAVVRAAVKRFGAERSWLVQQLPDRSLRLLAAFPMPEEPLLVDASATDETSPTSVAMRGGQCVAYPAPGIAWEPGPFGASGDPDGQRGLALPLSVGGSVFGVLHLQGSAEWSASIRMSVLESLALHAASSLMNARLYEQMRDTARLLEDRVQERTAELREANQELDAFAHSVSHDLRAPLRNMRGFLGNVLRDHGRDLSQGVRESLAMLACCVEEMDQLIQSLLVFSRSARQPLYRRTVDMQALVPKALEALRPDMEGRAIELRIGDLPPCSADPTLIQQVLTNLLSNAVKYTRPRDLAIIEVGCRMDGDRKVYFVKDNGVGFDPSRAGRLFRVFQRLHPAKEFPGHGIGLATVRRIIHRHGGHLWFEAEPDRGAAFFFTLGTEDT